MAGTVLVLVPHPDDAEFHVGGTIAKFAREGYQIIIVVATDGRCGSLDQDAETLIRLRSDEAKRGASVLGAEPPIMLGHPDFGLDLLPPGVLREQFIRLIRQYQPDILIAQDAFAPGEVHPDHRCVALAASDAVHFAALPLVHPEHLQQGLAPHYVVEKYFFAEGSPDCTKIVDVTATMDIRIAALNEHTSQMRFLVDDVLRQAALAGIDVRAIFGEAADHPEILMAWALQSQAAEVGARIGVKYGEAFRYIRFHPFIESLIPEKK